METIKVQITGVSPLLIHKYVSGTVSEASLRKNKGNDSDNYKEEWVKTLYLNREGQLVMPSDNLRACIFEGCKGLKKGKAFLTRIIQPSIDIQPWEPLVLFDDQPITVERIRQEGWVHTTGVVIGRARVDRQRAMLLPGWTIDFNISLLNEQLTSKDINDILQNAGQWAGLGDWRPSAKKPGAYGRFTVEILA